MRARGDAQPGHPLVGGRRRPTTSTLPLDRAFPRGGAVFFPADLFHPTSRHPCGRASAAPVFRSRRSIADDDHVTSGPARAPHRGVHLESHCARPGYEHDCSAGPPATSERGRAARAGRVNHVAASTTNVSARQQSRARRCVRCRHGFSAGARPCSDTSWPRRERPLSRRPALARIPRPSPCGSRDAFALGDVRTGRAAGRHRAHLRTDRSFAQHPPPGARRATCVPARRREREPLLTMRRGTQRAPSTTTAGTCARVPTRRPFFRWRSRSSRSCRVMRTGHLVHAPHTCSPR